MGAWDGTREVVGRLDDGRAARDDGRCDAQGWMRSSARLWILGTKCLVDGKFPIGFDILPPSTSSGEPDIRRGEYRSVSPLPGLR